MSVKERAGEIYLRVKMTVEKFAIGKVTDDDFRVELIDGADVIDADHGHLIVNPTSRLAEIGDLVAEINSSRRSWWAWIGLVASVIAVVGGWWWWWWRRRTATPNAKVG